MLRRQLQYLRVSPSPARWAVTCALPSSQSDVLLQRKGKGKESIILLMWFHTELTCFSFFQESAAATEPASAAHSAPPAGGSPPTGAPTAAEQRADQWDCRRGWDGHGGCGARPAAQSGLGPQSGACEQEAPPGALGRELRRACSALRLSGTQLGFFNGHTFCEMGSRIFF